MHCYAVQIPLVVILTAVAGDTYAVLLGEPGL